MDVYEQCQYSSGANVIRDTVFVEKAYALKKSDQSQIVYNVLLIGLKDYEKIRDTFIYLYVGR